MKKALSLILALTLAMALVVPALAADYGKVTINTEFNGEFVFDEAIAEKTDVTLVDFFGEDVVYENATLVSVKPGSTSQGECTAHGYYLDDSGKYNQVEGLIYTLDSNGDNHNVDDWFLQGTPEDGGAAGKTISLYAVFGSDESFYFVVLGKDEPTSDSAPAPETAPAAKPAVILTNQNLTVDGEAKETEIYNIDGSNYFKLRDMAALLSGTGSQFSVEFDAERSTIVVKTGEAYTAVGGELETGTDKSASAVASAQSVEIDGEKVDLTAYNIGGNNFFKLRDLGAALDFGVDYDDATATMVVTSK